MRSFRTKYLRSDNQRIWAPMLGSIIVQYAAVIINHLFDVNRIVYWILFGVSLIAGLLFIVFSIKYVEQWHQKLALFNINESDLQAVGSFLIAMSRSKEYNHYELKRLKVEYTLGSLEEYTSLDKKLRHYFPIRIKQTVQGTARGLTSEYYYHMTTNPATRQNGLVKVEYKTDSDREYKPIMTKDSSKRQIKCYSLGTISHHNNDNIQYKIKTAFEKNAGITAESGGRLYLYPSNFSKRITRTEGGNTFISVVVPQEYTRYLKDPKIRIIGERNSQNSLGRIADFTNKQTASDGTRTFTENLNTDENMLILIEFESKEKAS